MTKKQKVIFYSWQSDLPNSLNRGFIQDALKKTAVSIASNDTLDVQPVIDRDTEGIPGSPDIAATIFEKISSASVFVTDVSIVCRRESGRATPNPNVLVELGYAMKALGYERVILVFNKAFGKIEELPFDLNKRRAISYEVSAETTDKLTEKNILIKKLEAAIVSAIKYENKSLEEKMLAERRKNSIRIRTSNGIVNMLGEPIVNDEKNNM